jgi:hypothetical protein
LLRPPARRARLRGRGSPRAGRSPSAASAAATRYTRHLTRHKGRGGAYRPRDAGRSPTRRSMSAVPDTISR